MNLLFSLFTSGVLFLFVSALLIQIRKSATPAFPVRCPLQQRHKRRRTGWRSLLSFRRRDRSWSEKNSNWCLALFLPFFVLSSSNLLLLPVSLSFLFSFLSFCEWLRFEYFSPSISQSNFVRDVVATSTYKLQFIGQSLGLTPRP